jgi:alanyl-tRNA synthetase
LTTADDVRARRIVADHARSAVFCLADGVLPANSGRGYVLRRLIRRAVLQGARRLGVDGPFFHLLVEPVVGAYGSHYGALVEKRTFVEDALRSEESLFRRTLGQGNDLLRSLLASLPAGAELPGRDAFRLYDTFGFPLEVTVEVAGEQGHPVGEREFAEAMDEAQERSRSADSREAVYGGVTVQFRFESGHREGPTPTRFVGYEAARHMSVVLGAAPMLGDDGTATHEAGIALDATPFYAASGGQVSDIGTIRLVETGETLAVKDVLRQDGVLVHLVEFAPDGVAGLPKAEAAAELNRRWFGKSASAEVDLARRTAVTRHHTATHLLHAALRERLGGHVAQAGSLVAPEHLRFDFTHPSAITDGELADVEARVNELALAAVPVVTYAEVPLEEARAMGAMALFGEKYAERVRVVQIGDMRPDEPSFSRELCGGIHVANTGQLGLFKIVHEGSAAGGVRRITAVAGLQAYSWVREAEHSLRTAADRLKAPPSDVVLAIERLQEALRDERKKRERLAQAQSSSDAVVEPWGAFEWAVAKTSGLEPGDAKALADRLVDGHGNRVALVVNVEDGKLTFVCKAGPSAVAAGAHAGNVVRAAAQAAGGGGGGRADFATAGGKDASAAQAAVAAARAALPT